MKLIDSIAKGVTSAFSLEKPFADLTKRDKIFQVTSVVLMTLGILSIIVGALAAAITGNPIFLTITGAGVLQLIPSLILLVASSISKGKIQKPSDRKIRKTPTPPEVTPTTYDPRIEKGPFCIQSVLGVLNRHFSEPTKEAQCSRFITSKERLIEVVSCRGSIEIPFEKDPYGKDARRVVFNAANEHVHAGGGGTNFILSKSVSSRSWEGSRPRNAQGDARSLHVGEASLGAWESTPAHSDLMINEGMHPWNYLGHILGPQARSHGNKACPEAFQEVKMGFKDALDKAIERRCTVIQMPLISCGLYAAQGKDAEAWKAMAIQAFLAAVIELEESNKRLLKELGGRVIIYLIDKGTQALQEYFP